jgi:exonuclease III/ribonuclease HI
MRHPRSESYFQVFGQHAATAAPRHERQRHYDGRAYHARPESSAEAAEASGGHSMKLRSRNINTADSRQVFKAGDTVMARWKDGEDYTATVVRVYHELGDQDTERFQSSLRYEVHYAVDNVHDVVGEHEVRPNYMELSEECILAASQATGTEDEDSFHAYFNKLGDSAAMAGPTEPAKPREELPTPELYSDSSDSDEELANAYDDDTVSIHTDTDTDTDIESEYEELPTGHQRPARDECRESEDEPGCLQQAAICNFPIVTWNLNGLSSETERWKFISKNVDKLKQTYKDGVILLQEVRLARGEVDHGLRKLLGEHWGLYYENDTSDHAGVITCISPTLMKQYKVEENTHPFGEELTADEERLFRGRVLNLTLEPIEREDGKFAPPSVSITNVYLPSGGKFNLIANMLDKMRDHLHKRDYNYCGGDFNFVLQVEDHSPSKVWTKQGYYDITDKLHKSWTNFAEELNLTEVVQSQHTHFSFRLDDQAHSSTAKLDRIYTSHSQAELAIYEAVGHIADVPYSVFSHLAVGDDGIVFVDHKTKRSDHAPVGAYFLPTKESAKRNACIPRWIAEHKDFKPKCLDAWQEPAAHVQPEQAWASYKQCMLETARAVAKNIKQGAQVVNDTHGRYAIAIALLRITQRRPFSEEDTHQMLNRFPQLKGLATWEPGGQPDITPLKQHINSLLAAAASREERDIAREMMSKTFPLGDNPQDPVTNPGHGRVAGKAEKLKLLLSSLRKRIRMLREERRPGQPQPEATCDPAEMAKIAKKFWKKIWAKTPRCMRPHPARYLGANRVISKMLEPTLPTLDELTDIMINTNNSCPGPDGIPFAAYRALAATAAPILHKLLCFFAGGGLPSDEFNRGLLYLLPKKDTMLARDTRPISVTNTDNRILAKAIVQAITPALSDPVNGIHLDQKGAVAGRQGTDHVRNMAEKFYEAAEGGEQPYSLLFMDTKKAFDSIHHDFLFEVLVHFGLPIWVIRAIRALLHQVSVSPHFGECTGEWIRIRRGVKQGCPLSPWIFAMAMDVLIRRLRARGVDVYAYVDDIALGTQDFRKFAGCMRTIDRFSAVSGLGINHDKTKGVCSQEDGRYQAWARSARCPWREDFEVVLEYVYLGFLTGKWVTAAGVYRAAFMKFRDKLASYRATIRTLTPSKRNDVFNIFILPLLSYLAPLYSLPSEGAISHTTTKKLVREALVPFGGSGFGYQQLIAPRDGLGFGNPVTDVWAYMVSVMAAQEDFEQFRGLETVRLKEKVSMRTTKQRYHMAAEFVNWDLYVRTTANQPFPKFDPDHYNKTTPARRRKAIYNTMVKGSLKFHKQDKNLISKLKARGLPHSMGDLHKLQANHARITSAMPNTARYHQTAMLYNAVATGKRARHFTGATEEQYRCRACGAGDDSVAHTLSPACVAIDARTEFGQRIGYDMRAEKLGAADEWACAFGLINCSYQEQAVNALVAFNYAVWLAQVKFFRKLSEMPARSTAISKIVHIAIGVWARARLSTWKVPTSIRGTPYTVKKRGFGSTGSRTSEDKLRAKQEAIRLINMMSPDSAIGFTDGSAIPNPGPCGTGVVLYMPTHRHLLPSIYTDHTEASLTSTVGTEDGQAARPDSATVAPADAEETDGPLSAFTGLIGEGAGTNNLAELWGPAMLIQLLEWKENQTGCTHTGPIAIFIDSQLTIDICLYKARPAANKRLAHAVRRVVRTRGRKNPLFIYWLAGHADIKENELVDGKAKMGSKQAADGGGMVVAASIAANNYLPPQQAPYRYHALPP